MNKKKRLYILIGLLIQLPSQLIMGQLSFYVPGTSQKFCANTEINFLNTSSCPPTTIFQWKYDGVTSSSSAHVFTSPGTHSVQLFVAGGAACGSPVTQTIEIQPCTTACTDCIGSFAPEPGQYILSAWVKKETSAATDLTYTNPTIVVVLPSGALPAFSAKGDIIDGWQRIEESFNIPSGTASITIRLKCLTGANCLYDDIRILPFDGSMKSYVYDPVTLRLVAELDERNYATLYEYDEEGKLVRVKKETEKGIMTIKENKNSSKKK